MQASQLTSIASTLTASVMSIVKIALLSRWRMRLPHRSGAIVVLGNGPSLNDTLSHSRPQLMALDRMAVNFAANAPEFAQLQPQHYVLADPHFFDGDGDANVARLWQAFARVTWPMCLYIPAPVKLQGEAAAVLAANSQLTGVRYNLTPVEGWHWLERLAFARGLGMPRPRNVLIPSIMLALGCGYHTVYVAGADHSWTRTLSVDDDNHVVSVQPHFYKDGADELQRQRKDYMHYPLHQILGSFAVAFRSYFTIRRYARSRNAAIINVTPGSFIDAFDRGTLPEAPEATI